MTQAPQVTVTADKAEYAQGDAVTLTFSAPADTRTVIQPRQRTVHWTACDDEGNTVEASIEATVQTPVQVPDGLTVTDVFWEDTGVRFQISGLQATGTA